MNPHPSVTEPIPDLPFRIVLKPLPKDDAGLCCPVCGTEYLHPVSVIVEQGYTRTEVNSGGTTVAATDRFCRARGSLIEVGLVCEQGHDVRYALEFHQGQTFLALAAACGDPRQPIADLWRQ